MENYRIIRKSVFVIGQVPIKIWVENPVLAIQHIENRICFTEVMMSKCLKTIIKNLLGTYFVQICR